MQHPLERVRALAATLKEAELRVLLELAGRAAQEHNPQISISLRGLAQETSLYKGSIIAALRSLDERGLVRIQRDPSRRASSYRLNLPPAMASPVLAVRGGFPLPRSGSPKPPQYPVAERDHPHPRRETAYRSGGAR